MSRDETADDLPPPPRTVTPGLRVRLLTGTMALVGSIALCVTGFLGTLQVLATDLPGTRLLAAGGREAPGDLESVKGIDLKLMGELVYRWSYSFTLPDGTRLWGVSYSTGRLRLAPVGSRRVTVEYHPVRPRVNRLKGTRTGSMPVGFLPWAFLPPPIALAVLIAGLRRGRRRIHLLIDGLVAEATLKTGKDTGNGSDPEPFPEFRRRWESKRKRESRWISCWMIGVRVIFAFGLIMLVALSAGVVFSDSPLMVNGQMVSREFAILFHLVFTACWLGAYPIMTSPILVTVRCTYEFRLPDGAVIEATEEATMSDRLGDRPTEPVLYDPAAPPRTLLVDGLYPPVRFGPSGAWESVEERSILSHPVRRLLVVVLMPLAGPFLGWIAWSVL